MNASVFVCALKMYPAMESGDHEGECVSVCEMKMYPAMVSGHHERKNVCVCVC